ncbi:alpha/beta fold hydrolase [Deinococcus peraridilitoris]|uniref:Putative hydrolase or acyltransferase of alpha/beta superfamily n=1 Tax=Deinococcus peraridilitoris (strain DSM 19664 / LMG 22246 / CIP 109416 / KR-200) TaxID=937777 RepID=K9ZYU4_DEIPD|nr:alpha/beta hydrolase [Deinococcus peraridilitoris]AFZ66756.1 putative hydrolase or acyltransferase of alpha/beta superfamily [Deinococcus peraridilitoris DSM 19664]
MTTFGFGLSFGAPKFVDLGGRRLAYDEVTPQNPQGTLLLLSGLGSKRFGWGRQLPVFGQHYRTIAMDHRDVGDSDPFEEPYTMHDQADDAAALLRALGVEGAHVAGISMGGMVALNLAQRHPQLVRSLILVATSAGGRTHVGPTAEAAAVLRPDPGQEIGERAQNTYRIICRPGHFDSRPEEAELVAQLARYKPMRSAAYLRQYEAARGHDVTTHLQDIRAPSLVIHGDLDPLVPVGNGRMLAQRLPGARLHEYPGIGHMPIMECPDEFNRDVLEFLGTLDDQSKENA